MKKFLHVVGARPNFPKVAAVHSGLSSHGVTQRLVHTGQHYDDKMSQVFFDQLALPRPDINLQVGSGSHAEQTAKVMIGFEKVLLDERPDCVLVYGDVNSTLAAALVCAKLGVPVAHVEAGLRSFDRTMPEELNRLVTDQLADLLFTPSADGDDNLRREGIPNTRIHLVGNVMIDTLVRCLPLAERVNPPPAPAEFALVTLHRPANVDEERTLRPLFAALATLSQSVPIIFPVHPRTRERLTPLLGGIDLSRVQLVEPLGYLEFLWLQKRARLVITDSGGVQEETTYLGVPCLTLRDNTERPITVSIGTNQVIGRDPAQLLIAAAAVLAQNSVKGAVPPLWDGRTGERIAAILTRN